MRTPPSGRTEQPQPNQPYLCQPHVRYHPSTHTSSSASQPSPLGQAFAPRLPQIHQHNHAPLYQPPQPPLPLSSYAAIPSDSVPLTVQTPTLDLSCAPNIPAFPAQTYPANRIDPQEASFDMSMSLFELPIDILDNTTPTFGSFAPAPIESHAVALESLFQDNWQALPPDPQSQLPADFDAGQQYTQSIQQIQHISPIAVQSPLQGMIMSQFAQTYRSPSDPTVAAIVEQRETSLGAADGSDGQRGSAEQTNGATRQQQQDAGDSGQAKTGGAEEGGKIWDLFPAITPQMQSQHFTSHTSGAGQQDAQDRQQAQHQLQQQQQHQQQHQMLTQAMYHQQQQQVHAQAQAHVQAQNHHQHQPGSYAHAQWPSYGTYDHPPQPNMPPPPGPLASNPHPHILPGAALGQTIQHLLPSQTGMQQNDLMSLFVPSLMLPGYPRQVPVSESFMALASPVGSESDSTKKGRAGDKGVGGNADTTPRLAPAIPAHMGMLGLGQVGGTVPPPIMGVPIPRRSTRLSANGGDGQGDAEQNAGDTLQPDQQMDIGMTDEQHASADTGGAADSNSAAKQDTWAGIGVGIGVGLGLSEQTNWQTLPDGALDFAQPSSFRAVFDMSSFPSLGSASGIPITPFTGLDWLDWPETPLKTGVKPAGVAVPAEGAGGEANEGGSAPEASDADANAVPAGSASNGQVSAIPQSARFVSIPLYTVPGSAIDGSTNTEPTLALPPGVPLPTDVPMTGWIFDTADVGPDGGKGIKRKRGERGRPRGAFSSFRPITTPLTPAYAEPISTSDELKEAFNGLLGRLKSDVSAIVNRCTGSDLPAGATEALQTAMKQLDGPSDQPSIEQVRALLDHLDEAIELLPASTTEVIFSGPLPRSASSTRHPGSLSIDTREPTTASALLTGSTSRSAPSVRVPREEINMPQTAVYGAYGLPAASQSTNSLLSFPPPSASANSASPTTSTRPGLHTTKSMPAPDSASVRSPPPTAMSAMSAISGMSSMSSPSDTTKGKRYTGAWTSAEVDRLRQVAKDNKICLSSGDVVVDWKVAIELFGDTRSKHQILVKAVELGLKDTTTSSNRRKRQRKHRQAETEGAGPDTGNSSKTSPSEENSRTGRSWSASELDGDGVMF